jgi:hypothetical protein
MLGRQVTFPKIPRAQTLIRVSVVAIFLLSVLIQLHFVSDHAGATVFQRGSEAYLFLGGGHNGWHFPAALYPAIVAKEYFNAPTAPSDVDAKSLVIRISPDGTQRWTNPSANIAFLTPFPDGFYALCPGSVLCKWTETGFRQATPEETQGIRVDDLRHGTLDNQLINGWTTHELKFSPGDHFEVHLPENVTIRVADHTTREFGRPDVTVDLLRPGQPAERIYQANASSRLVSASQYARLFPTPQ